MARTTVPLHRLARTIRSKNAGAHHYTLDIIFDEPETYEWVVESGVLTRESVAALYGVPPERISQFVEYRPGNAIKITLRREVSSGDWRVSSARSRSWRSVPGAGSATRRRW